MNKLFAVTLTDIEDSNPCKTWIFDDKKEAYMFLCNKYESLWKKYYIPDSKGNYEVVESKSVYPFVDDYKNNDIRYGKYYNIHFKHSPEIIMGICEIKQSQLKTENPDVSKDFLSWVGEDLKEAFNIAEDMIKNPDNITFGDMIWLCATTGMRREILGATGGTWLKVVEDALRKLGYRF